MENYMVVAGSLGEGTVEVWWHGGTGFQVFVDDVEVDYFTYYGGPNGEAPSQGQAKRVMEDHILDMQEEELE